MSTYQLRELLENGVFKELKKLIFKQTTHQIVKEKSYIKKDNVL